MGGRGSPSRMTAPPIAATPPIMATPPPAVMQAAGGAPVTLQMDDNTQANSVFSATDTQGYHDLYGGRQYFQKQQFDSAMQAALVPFLDPKEEPGSLYNFAQNLNHAMQTGQPLTLRQKVVRDQLMKNMHNLGYNLNLQRYDHAPFINQLLSDVGVRNADYTGMSIGQIKTALVGHRFGMDGFISTSYNDFKKSPQSSTSVFKTRAVKIEFRAAAKTQALMPGTGGGGDLGEIVLAPSNGRKNMRIVDAEFTGVKARRKGSQSFNMPQIKLVIEVE